MEQPWKVGDWVVFDRSIGQIKELRDDGCATFTDGSFETSGRLCDRFRPLTLQNKNIAENFDAWYKMLREIDGESGFNYPDISSYFSELALRAIDGENAAGAYDDAQRFVADARNYKPTIQGLRLFRPKLLKRSVHE